MQDIKVGDLEGIYRMSISITDISEHKMEKINYRVVEDENETFSFYCETFELGEM